MTDTQFSNRAIIRISATDPAEDVREFLQGLITQDLQLVQPRAPQWSALLNAQGKIMYDFFLWADEDDILIDCESNGAEALAKRLKLYRLRRKIGIELDDKKTVHWSKNAVEQPTDPRLSELGHRWLSDTVEGGGVDELYLAHRLSLGVTEGQAELGAEKILWLECNADELNGVSFTKGCYIGQENTARMNYRQKINRRMVVVPIDQADEKRQRTAYPELGLSVEHRKVDDMDGLTLPAWLSKAL
ncbi:MAG: folate-binding protein [Parasphingorhabdus sp.]